MIDENYDDEECECEEDNELELVMGEDGILHLKTKRPTVSLSFQTDTEMIEFMANCSVLGLKRTLIIPEGVMWEVDNVVDRDSFFETLNKRVDELNK